MKSDLRVSYEIETTGEAPITEKSSEIRPAACPHVKVQGVNVLWYR
jgi:hypothetical protein